MLRYARCNIVIVMAATAWLMLYFSSCIVCGFDLYTVLLKCPQRKFLGDGGEIWKVRYTNQIHARYRNWRTTSATQFAAITITMLHPVYLNMVTARLFTNCSNTLRNIHTNARENIRRTRAKRKAGYFFVAHSVYCVSPPAPSFPRTNAGIMHKNKTQSLPNPCYN